MGEKGCHNWGLDGGLFSFDDAVPCHGPSPWTLPFCAPSLLLRRYVVALPAQMFGQKRSKTPIKGGGARPGKGLAFWFVRSLVGSWLAGETLEGPSPGTVPRQFF